jgi:hypothetical protein
MKGTDESTSFIVIFVELLGCHQRIIEEEVGQAGKQLMRDRRALSERSHHSHRCELLALDAREDLK